MEDSIYYAEHSPEGWTINSRSADPGGEDAWLATTGHGDEGIARHIATCLNVCAGVPTTLLEDDILGKLFGYHLLASNVLEQLKHYQDNPRQQPFFGNWARAVAKGQALQKQIGEALLEDRRQAEAFPGNPFAAEPPDGPEELGEPVREALPGEE